MPRPSRKFLNLVLTAAGIMLVAIAMAATGGPTATAAPTAGPQSVIVKNDTTGEPVPVSGTVALVAGTQITVANPSISVSGSVNIGNSPTVTVGNSAAAPAMVSDVAYKTPFSLVVLSNAINVSPGRGFPIGNVPAGKRFVIEQVGASCAMATGIKPLVSLSAGGFLVDVPVTFQGNFPFSPEGRPGGDYWVGLLQTRVAVDTIDYVDLSVSDFTAQAQSRVTLRGYLIDQ